MKRTPLLRVTPLRRSGPPKRKARPARDKVTPSERSVVINRDRVCFLSRLNPEHRCATQFGDPHPANAVLLLTLDHFWHKGARKGDRAPSDRYHMVAMCGAGNVNGPSHEVREAERSYIRTLYPDWIVTDSVTEEAA